MLTDLSIIADNAVKKQAENDEFGQYLRQFADEELDPMVQRLNDIVTPQVNCLECAACCKTLMIEVSESELRSLESTLDKKYEEIKIEYVEEGLSGKMILNSIPCKFLNGKACSVYTQRFSPCSEFPHLHRSGFNNRLFSTFMYYGICPIIYNVVEELKTESGFNQHSL